MQLLRRIRRANAHRAGVREPESFAKGPRRNRHRVGVRAGDIEAAIQPGAIDLARVVEDRARRKHGASQPEGRQDAHVPRVARRRDRGAGAGQR
ncbi:hypothetical protein G6F59_018161 [Rhizopus arrhizus]|nr:hypothetical protein G6F59_018161 [Rhizopus arrhizus]